ncbi:MAG TPA: magnesium transporter [Bacilli bacterium]|jgi:magnesium transporter|nr:magnesium transporter [Bacilli bacterium]
MEDKFELLEHLRIIIDNRDVKALREFCNTIEPVDFADAANSIEDVSKLLFVFRTVESEYTAEVFTELSTEQQNRLIELFSDKQIKDLIENTYTDDIVKFLTDMPSNLVNRVLQKADKETRRDINTILNYQPYTAGSLMTTEYIELRGNLTVKQALDYIRENGQDAITIYDIFIIDNKRNLVEVVGLDKLIFAEDNEEIAEIAKIEPVFVHVSTDQEEVARLFKRYDKTTLPVLNKDNKMVGVITVDDIIDVIVEEHTEDIARMAAVAPLEKSYRESSIMSLVKSSLPWLILLMVLGIFSSLIINKFESQIATVIIMSSFIPLLLASAGNAGTQTASLVIRSLALNEYHKGEYRKIIGKEIKTGLLVALGLGLFTFAFIPLLFIIGIVNVTQLEDLTFVKWSPNWWISILEISGTISITITISIVISKFVGAILPLTVRLIKKDPALMSNPFITTISDIVTLIIYFLLIMVII